MAKDGAQRSISRNIFALFAEATQTRNTLIQEELDERTTLGDDFAVIPTLKSQK